MTETIQGNIAAGLGRGRKGLLGGRGLRDAPIVISVLFCDPRGCYADVPGLDLWPAARDARTYPGPHRVIAHPPCSRWCRLAAVNQKRWGAMIGDDGGCFQSALDSVMAWGGVLEHPAYSIAWAHHGLQRPERGSWQASPEGWVTEVSQVAYGHAARKRTWLLVVSQYKPMDLDWTEPPAKARCGHKRGQTQRKLGKKEASATPLAFRDLLITLAGR